MTKAFFAAVAGCVGVVLLYLIAEESLKEQVAWLELRVRRLWDNRGSGRLHRRHLGAALVGVAIAALTAGAIVAARDLGSRAKVAPEAVPKPRPIGNASLASPRAAHFWAVKRTAKPAARTRRTPEKRVTRVSYVVKTTTAPAASTQPAPSVGPAPLPAPNASPPSPLTPP